MRFANQLFQGGEVTLDYNEFVDCVFQDRLCSCGWCARMAHSSSTSC